MANGDIITNIRDCFEVVLLDAQSTTSTGVWREVPAHLNIWAITTGLLEEGATDAIIDIHVYDGPTKLADATAGDAIIARFNNIGTPPDQSYEGPGGHRYVKAAK